MAAVRKKIWPCCKYCTSQNALQAVCQAVRDMQTQTTHLTQALQVQTQLTALQSRQATLTALLVARQTTRDRRVELRAANSSNLPLALVDEATAAYNTTWQELQDVQTEIATLLLRQQQSQSLQPNRDSCGAASLNVHSSMYPFIPRGAVVPCRKIHIYNSIMMGELQYLLNHAFLKGIHPTMSGSFRPQLLA